jgi:membrane protease subunit (stomatin/prohibitin family)
MSLWSKVTKQFLDVIEWTEADDATLAWRFPIEDNEIQNGAQLTVRESQVALFVDQGRVADAFRPGRYRLTTEVLPILTTLKSWPYAFNAPFKSEVYFYSTRQKLGQRWGTPQPIAVRDREMGSVMLRMFGTFSYHVADEKVFYREVSGTREAFRTEDLAVQAVPQVSAAAAMVFGQSNVPFLDMAANQIALSDALKGALRDPFAKLGVALDAFVVESVSLPPELQQALTDRQSMGIVGDLHRYAQYEAARSIPDAARNEGGLAGLGAGVAVGAGIGQMMSGALSGAGAGAGSAGAAPAGGAAPAAATAPCSSCGKPITAGDPFCRHCGQAQQRTCPSCKSPVAADAAFCSKCGSKLG